jgi:NAD(P)H-dependent FMN reductase
MDGIAFSGSLRAKSSNTELLRAARRLAPPTLRITLYQRIHELPHFNADLDAMSIPVVAELTQLVKNADAVIVSSPEYAFGVPGSLKNAFDWLVGGDGFVHKPFVLLGTSPRSTTSRAAWVKTLTAMSGQMIESASITLPLLGTDLDADGIAAHREHAPALRAALLALESALTARGIERRSSDERT